MSNKPSAERQLVRSAELATRLQKVVADFILEGGESEQPESGLAIIVAVGSTFGWFLQLTLSRGRWAPAIRLVSEQSVLAAEAYAKIAAQSETIQ